MSSSRSSARVIHAEATLEIQVERNTIADKLREGRLFIRERFHQSPRSWYLFRLLRSSTLCVDVDVRGKSKAFVSHRSARTLSPLTFSHIVSPQFTSPCIPPILSHLQSAGNFIYFCQSRPACRKCDFSGGIPCAINSFKVACKVSANKMPFSFGFIFYENLPKFPRHSLQREYKSTNFERRDYSRAHRSRRCSMAESFHYSMKEPCPVKERHRQLFESLFSAYIYAHVYRAVLSARVSSGTSRTISCSSFSATHPHSPFSPLRLGRSIEASRS